MQLQNTSKMAGGYRRVSTEVVIAMDCFEHALALASPSIAIPHEQLMTFHWAHYTASACTFTRI
jgi:hypothetical protein